MLSDNIVSDFFPDSHDATTLTIIGHRFIPINSHFDVGWSTCFITNRVSLLGLRTVRRLVAYLQTKQDDINLFCISDRCEVAGRAYCGSGHVQEAISIIALSITIHSQSSTQIDRIKMQCTFNNVCFPMQITMFGQDMQRKAKIKGFFSLHTVLF